MHYINLTFLTSRRDTNVLCLKGIYTNRRYTWTLSQPTVSVDRRDVPSMLATGLVREV
jgi:hypothetical protein